MTRPALPHLPRLLMEAASLVPAPTHLHAARTLSHQGLGNMVSDVCGLGLSSYVEVRCVCAIPYSHTTACLFERTVRESQSHLLSCRVESSLTLTHMSPRRSTGVCHKDWDPQPRDDNAASVFASSPGNNAGGQRCGHRDRVPVGNGPTSLPQNRRNNRRTQ
jgi:hypothetical protein